MEIESNYGRGMRRRGIGGLSRGMDPRMAMGRQAYPTPMRGQNFDLPSRPMGMQDPMGGYQPTPPPSMGGIAAYTPPGQMPAQAAAQPIGAPGYRPPATGTALGMDFSVGAPGTSLGQPASDPRQQQEMKRSAMGGMGGQPIGAPPPSMGGYGGGPMGGPSMGGPMGGPSMGGPMGGPSMGGPMGGPSMGGPGDVSGNRADIQARYGLSEEETTAAIESQGQSLAGRPPAGDPSPGPTGGPEGAPPSMGGYGGGPMGGPEGAPPSMGGYGGGPMGGPEGAPPSFGGPGDVSGHRADIQARYGLSEAETTAAIESQGQSLSGRSAAKGATTYGGQPMGGQPRELATGTLGGQMGGGLMPVNQPSMGGPSMGGYQPIGAPPAMSGYATPPSTSVQPPAAGMDWPPPITAQPVGGGQQPQMLAGTQQIPTGPRESGILGQPSFTPPPSASGFYGGGIIGLAQGGVVPGYFLGNLISKVGKAAAKLAPLAVGFIPGIGGLAAPLQGLIGGAAKGVSDLAQNDWNFDALNVDSILQQGMGAAFMAKAQQDPEWAIKNRNKIEAMENLSSGQAGGQGTSATANRMMPPTAGSPGASGARGGSGSAGVITDVEQGAAQKYNMFNQLTGKAGGGQVGSLYAMRRFGGGPIKGYQEGGEFEDEMDEPRYRPPPPRRTSRRRSSRAQQEAARRREAERAEEARVAEDIEPALPATVAALRPPPPPAPPPVVPWQPPPDPGAEGETLPDEIYSAAPNTAANYAPEPWQLPPDPSLTGGDASTDASSAAAAEAAAEAINAKQRQEAADYAMRNKDYSNLSFEEEVARQKKEKQTEAKQELIATNQLDPDDKGEQVEEMGEPDEQDLYTIDDKKAADMKKDAGVTPSGKLDLNTGEVTRNEEYIAANTAPPLPPPPPVPETFAPAPTMEPASGGLFGAPTERQNVNMFEGASGFDPFNMPTQASQFANADPRMEAMLNRMNTEPAALRKLEQPKKEDTKAKGKAEGGVVESMQEMPEVMEMLQMALQAPDDPQSQEIISTLMEAFGEEDFQKLVASLQAGPSQGIAPPMQSGGKIPGNGDAMADDIRLTADAGTPNAQDIDISSGEFVVAGDVVSHLGSGNTDRGANVLSQFQEDVRVNRTGSPEQAPPIDLEEVLPGTYGERYA
jgi:hypothetical protein